MLLQDAHVYEGAARQQAEQYAKADRDGEPGRAGVPTQGPGHASGAFKSVKDPITRRHLIDKISVALRRMMGKKKQQRRKARRPRQAFVSPEEAASVGMGWAITYGALRSEECRRSSTRKR